MSNSFIHSFNKTTTMSYVITGYEIINGSKLESREKRKPKNSLKDINDLQERAERIWNCSLDESHKLSVYINYTNLNWYNPKADAFGKHDFKLEKWL